MDVVNTMVSTTPTVESDKEDETKADYSKILKEARERYADVCERDKENIDNAVADVKFVYKRGEQWPDAIKAERKAIGLPCLEFPQLKQFVNQVVNDQRQNRPGIRIHPADNPSSKPVADIMQGLIRGIEYDSQAESVYDEGYKSAVVSGRGWWRVCSQYEKAPSFNQKIVIERIVDQNSVRGDIDYTQPDGADRRFVFVSETLTKEEFEEKWPDAEPLSFRPDGECGGWYDDDKTVRVADYYRRVCTKRTLVTNSDGAIGFKDEMPELPEGVQTIASREVDSYTVEWYKIAGGEQVLAKYDWPGETIPVVCCVGDEITIDGKRIYQGLIRQARDAQSVYNYEQSMKVMRLSLSPLSPFVAEESQIADYEQVWKDANKKPFGVLPYKQKSIDGNLLPPPQRQSPAAMESGWIEAANQAKGDIKSAIGMYENNLGMRGSEVSGRAINAREKQGDNATFHFADNFARAIALTGRIIVEVVPKYYDTHRIVTTVGLDDKRKQVAINQPAGPDQAVNDITKGNFTVICEAGPSFATKREETSQSMIELANHNPGLMQIAGDLLVGNMDFADSDKIAERLKMALPPQIAQAVLAQEQGQDPQMAQMAAHMKQMQEQAQQAIQQLHGQLQQTTQELEMLKKNQGLKVEVEQIKSSTEKMTAALDFITNLVKLQQTQAQNAAQEATGMVPAVQGIEGSFSQ
jgi:hypothetical protein